MSQIPTQFPGVTAVAKANVYFDGRVVSHSILFPDGSKKTLGLIYPGTFHFGTDKAERMEIVAGACRVKLDGQTNWNDYTAAQMFEIPAKSGFDIEVKSGICEYVCSFLGCGIPVNPPATASRASPPRTAARRDRLNRSMR